MADRSLQLVAVLEDGEVHLTVWEVVWEDGRQLPVQELVRTTRRMPLEDSAEDWRRDVAVALAELL